jgi:hypothetical protein
MPERKTKIELLILGIFFLLAAPPTCLGLVEEKILSGSPNLLIPFALSAIGSTLFTVGLSKSNSALRWVLIALVWLPSLAIGLLGLAVLNSSGGRYPFG